MNYGLAICAGVGGIELGLQMAIPGYRAICYVEREAYAAAVLASRIQDQCLPSALIWDDVSTFNGRPFRGLVSIVSSGIPCQPWSGCGTRRGTDDERWIWSEVARILGEVRPRIIFLENVPNITFGGLEHIAGWMAQNGYDASWDCFQASDVGSPHRRSRLFILGMANAGRGRTGMAASSSSGQAREHAGQSERTMVLPRHGKKHPKGNHASSNDAMADADGARCGKRGRAHKELIEAGFADARGNVDDGRGAGCDDIAKWPPRPNAERYPPGLEPCVLGVDARLPDRLDRVRAIGNSVLPSVAALAFATLRAKLEKSKRNGGYNDRH